METLSVIQAVANRLRELNPDMDIHISSADAKVYIPTRTAGNGINSRYCGSVFAEPEIQMPRYKTTNPDFRHRCVPQISDAR